MKITIKVTKKVLAQSASCGIGTVREVSTNCAFAMAVREIAPLAFVGNDKLGINRFFIYWMGFGERKRYQTPLSDEGNDFIKRFDTTEMTNRPLLPEASFEVDFPDELVQEIGIDQVYKILSESKTLELAAI